MIEQRARGIGDDCFICECCGEVKDYGDLDFNDDSADVCKQCSSALAEENRRQYAAIRKAITAAWDEGKHTVALPTHDLLELMQLFEGWLQDRKRMVQAEKVADCYLEIQARYEAAGKRAGRFHKALVAANRRWRLAGSQDQ